MTNEQLSNLEQRTLALAGIFQNCHQVQQLANSGQIDRFYLNIAVKAIINTEPDNALEVFDGLLGIREGLQLIVQQLSGDSKKRSADLTRYSISVLFLAGKLLKNPAMLNELSQGIEKPGHR